MIERFFKERDSRKMSKQLQRSLDALYKGKTRSVESSELFEESFFNVIFAAQGNLSPVMIRNSVLSAWLHTVQNHPGSANVVLRCRNSDMYMVEAIIQSMSDITDPDDFPSRFEKARHMLKVMSTYPASRPQSDLAAQLIMSPLGIDHTANMYRLAALEPTSVETIRGLIVAGYDELKVRANLVTYVLTSVFAVEYGDVHIVVKHATLEEIQALSACLESRLQSRTAPLVSSVAAAVSTHGDHPSRSLRVAAALNGVRYPEDTDWAEAVEALELLGSAALVEALFGAEPAVC